MRILLISLFLWLSSALPAHAATSEWTKDEEGSARLVVGDKLETGMLRAGIEINLQDGWHTYWRTPGDAGVGPVLDWSKSTNVKSVEFLYPAPTRFIAKFDNFEPVVTYGYEHHVLFPLLVTPADPTAPTELKVNIKYAVCKELCLFFSPDLTQSIPADAVDEESTKLIDAAILAVPGRSEGLTIGEISLKEESKTLELNISGTEPLENPDIVVEVTPDFKFAEPQFFFAEDKKSAVAKISYKELVDGKTLKNMDATVTLKANGKAAEKKLKLGETGLAQAGGVPAKAPFESPVIPSVVEGSPTVTTKDPSTTGVPPSAQDDIVLILLAAFLGGLILNIMPCVLPVLSLKLLGIAKHGGGSAAHVRASFLASASGILASFLTLAVIVIALKEAGTAVGWGFHFQQPLFVIALIVLLNLFAASQWSLFEIRLPYWLGGRLSNLSPDADDHSLGGHFMTGVLATILATPCSAPYLGTAVGFALSQGAAQVLTVFAVMGLGLASPYLVFAVLPKLVTRLPRPGAWMLKVKHVMGYLLAATSGWLIWVLSMQVGMIAAAMVAALSLAGLLLLYMYKVRPFGKGAFLGIAAAGLAAIFILPMLFADTAPQAGTPMEKAMWQPFDEQAIPGLVAEGKTVFVDVTADWCLTCKFNKAHVLYVGKTHEALMRENVITMKADYTNPSKAIADFLKKNGRYGIPFNIVYGPGAPGGIPLSEYLTEDAVLDALTKAGKP